LNFEEVYFQQMKGRERERGKRPGVVQDEGEAVDISRLVYSQLPPRV